MKFQNIFFSTGALMLTLGALFAFSVTSTLGYAPADRPDLQITNIQANRLVTSKYANLTIQVQNRGERASRNSWVSIYVNNTFRRSCAVPALQGGQTQSIACKYYFSGGDKLKSSVPATFFVDDMEEIWESNENNNKEQFSIPTRSNITSSFVSRYSTPVATQYNTPVVTPTPQVIPSQSVCSSCLAQQAPVHIQESYTRYSTGNLYHYNPSAPIYTVKTNQNRVSCPFGTNRSCYNVVTYGQNDATGECKAFPTTCLPPVGWTRVARCESQTYSTEDTTAQTNAQRYFMTPSDEHFAVYNGNLALGQLIDVRVGEKVAGEVALMEIDNTKRNFVYQNISNKFSLETIDFPKDAVRCWTNRKSSGTTIYCRGQKPNTSIQYELRAQSAGSAPIFSRVQYDLNGEKIEREGTQNFRIN